MGILNVTPDSFSDGGRWNDERAAFAHGCELFEDGADVVDVGGESTRPGAEAVSVDEECARTVNVIRRLSQYGRVSIDTRKPVVAHAAIAAGATMLNDITGSLSSIAADHDIPWIAMHMQGTPEMMQHNPQYTDVISEVRDFLLRAAEQAKRDGVREVYIDPGIGFGKTVEHNLALLHNLHAFTSTGYPVVIGTSRKSFLGIVTSTGEEPASVSDRLEASLATAAWCALQNVAMIRVHDVRETKRMLQTLDAITKEAVHKGFDS